MKAREWRPLAAWLESVQEARPEAPGIQSSAARGAIMDRTVVLLILALFHCRSCFAWREVPLGALSRRLSDTKGARGRAGRVYGSTLHMSHTRRLAGPKQTAFLAKTNHPAAWNDDAGFMGFSDCNSVKIATILQVGERERMGQPMLEYLKGTEGVGESKVSGGLRALAFELACEEAIDSKEFFEAVEFYLRVRKRVRRRVVIDLACGHGLVGLLFACLERSVEKVVLVDKRRPASFDVLVPALARVAPWVTEKVSFCETDLFGPSGGKVDSAQMSAASVLDDFHAVPAELLELLSGLDLELGEGGQADSKYGCVAVHACGLATDRSLAVASALRGPVAAMPCCYYGKRQLSERSVPYVLKRALGKALASDIDRTYRLDRAGYHVDWASIPKCVTPMNRIIIATPRGGGVRPAEDVLGV